MEIIFEEANYNHFWKEKVLNDQKSDSLYQKHGLGQERENNR